MSDIDDMINSYKGDPRIKKHQYAIEILEIIDSAKRQIELNKESLNGFPGTFQNLKRKHTHRIMITNSAILRLEKRCKNLFI